MGINIVIPMAGRGSRFADAGYKVPKPLIDVAGAPMIHRVVENLSPPKSSHLIFMILRKHDDEYGIAKKLHEMYTCKTTVILVDATTAGPACTALLARDAIDNKKPLLIANSDQLVDWSPAHFRKHMKDTGADGGILTFISDNPKWSFARLDPKDACPWRVVEVAEKRPISNIATVGMYYFRRGCDFVKYADQMIAKDLRVNNEYYVCPVFQEMIGDGKLVVNYPIPRMYGLGTPEDMVAYMLEKHPKAL